MTTTNADALSTLFREQSGRLVAFLTRILGVQRVDLAEDVAQETLLAAVQGWSAALPPDPTAWLFVVARNRALDVLRRERVRRGAGVVDVSGDADADEVLAAEVGVSQRESDADLLRMMFSCCHPGLGEDAQTALILRLVCGFSTVEIAHAFFVAPATMEKRLVRAKKILADDGRLFDVDTVAETVARRAAVMAALYLMFDAGYHGGAADPVRQDVCADAIRLALLLAEARAATTPEAHALVALMCLHAARLDARTGPDGLVPLEQQDRARFSAPLIARGMAHLAASATGTTLSAFHLEAGIAAEHALAPSVEATRWPAIVDLYELLHAVKPTPLVALNRAIARARVDGAAAGVVEVLALDGRDRLERYPFFWTALGDLSLRAGDRGGAAAWFARGLDCCRNDVEREMLRRVGDCARAT